ncbi:hypothetical protein [Prescottella equi]|uniref:hypothetical protein n=1 Tax=Rhodococcus hoagii TaxID=43767 RepID=UPI0007CD5133|nr:hypothetical protein [Prescottella equi]ORL01549.1 hypothetical protein A6F56_04310 [Prescottella equi]
MSAPVKVRELVESIAVRVGLDVSDAKVTETIAHLEDDRAGWGLEGDCVPTGFELFIEASFAAVKAHRELEAGIDWSTEPADPQGFDYPSAWEVRTEPYELVRDWTREFRGVVSVIVTDAVGKDGRISREAPRLFVLDGERECGLARAGQTGLALLEAVEAMGGLTDDESGGGGR